MRFRKNRISIRKMRNLVHIFFIHMHNLYAFGVVFFPLLATYLSDSVHLDTLRSSNVRICASIFRNGHLTRYFQILLTNREIFFSQFVYVCQIYQTRDMGRTSKV
jgi:hypothetical protein